MDNTTIEWAENDECIFCESRLLDGDHKIVHMCDKCAENPTLALGERTKKAEATGDVDATISKICDSRLLLALRALSLQTWDELVIRLADRQRDIIRVEYGCAQRTDQRP